MKIGILKCGHLPDPLRDRMGDIDDMFVRLLGSHGLTFRTYDVEHLDLPTGAHACDGWLITGSKHGVYEEHAFIPPLEDLIRAAYDANVPLVGICFGHQIVARALGGRVEKFAGGWALGRNEYTLADGATIALNAWHQDQVLEPPEGATPLASNDFCANAVLAYGDRILTVQPHPEFQSDIIHAFATERRGTGTYPDALMDRAASNTKLPVDNARIGEALARFLKTRQIHV